MGDLIQKLPAAKEGCEARKGDEGVAKNARNSKTKHDGRNTEGRTEYEEHAQNDWGSRKETGCSKDNGRKAEKEELLKEGGGNGDRHHLVRPLHPCFDFPVLSVIWQL